MPSERPTSAVDAPARSHSAAIAALLVCEVCLAIAACWPHQDPLWAWPHPLDVICTSVLFSQYSLLGLWLMFGATRWWLRTLGFVAGSTLLWALAVYSEGGWVSRNIPLAMAFLVGMFLLVYREVLLGMRLRGIKLARDAASLESAGSFQFSIRSIVILTGVVAVLVAIGRYLESHGGLYNPYFGYFAWWAAHTPRGVADRFAFFLLAGPCFAAVGLLSVSFALGKRFSLVHASVAVFLAGALGLLPPMYFARPWRTHVYWPMITGLEALLVILPLAIMRRWGYRFTSTHEHAKQTIAATDGRSAKDALPD